LSKWIFERAYVLSTVLKSAINFGVTYLSSHFAHLGLFWRHLSTVTANCINFVERFAHEHNYLSFEAEIVDPRCCRCISFATKQNFAKLLF
jgi:hypothetical protein